MLIENPTNAFFILSKEKEDFAELEAYTPKISIEDKECFAETLDEGFAGTADIHSKNVKNVAEVGLIYFKAKIKSLYVHIA